MANEDRVLEYLRCIAPNEATNSEIVAHTGIRPHQQVFQLPQKLYKDGQIKGSKGDGEWRFWIGSTRSARIPAAPPSAFVPMAGSLAFEEQARRVMSAYFGVPLSLGKVPGVPEGFDLVSSDRQVVGDAKFYTLVNGISLPPAKFATIAEYVWMLEKVTARNKFIVFGNEPRVPEEWLRRYGRLVSGVEFFFIYPNDEVELLPGSR